MWRAALASGRVCVCGVVEGCEEVVWDGRAPADWWEAQVAQSELDLLPLADLERLTEGLEEEPQREDVPDSAAECETATSNTQPPEPASGLAEENEEEDSGGKPSDPE